MQQHRAWSKDDKQWLAGTGGRLIGHARNRENPRQQHHKNRYVHVAAIRALTKMQSECMTWSLHHSLLSVSEDISKCQHKQLTARHYGNTFGIGHWWSCVSTVQQMEGWKLHSHCCAMLGVMSSFCRKQLHSHCCAMLLSFCKIHKSFLYFLLFMTY